MSVDVMQTERIVRNAYSRFLPWAVLLAGAMTFAWANTARAGQVPAPEPHPLEKALDYARISQKAAAEVQDFEAVFTKREVIKGRMFHHMTKMKFRAEPMSVYLDFIKPSPGREVLYVDGQNNGKLLAHDTGIAALVGTVALSPTGGQAMSESRRPITSSGFSNLIDRMIKLWETEAQYDGTNVRYYPEAKLGEMKCLVVETTHPQPRREFKYHMTRLYIDKASRLPVRVENYAFPQRAGMKPPLVEEYTYSQIRTNVGLTDRDFDRRNPQYGF